MPITIGPQIFIVLSTEPCWKCKSVVPVVGLFTNSALEPEEEPDPFDDEICRLSNVSDMPEELLSIIHQIHSNYELRRSQAANQEYYMNTCSFCDAHFGDHFLHSEPGGAFFPMSAEESAKKQVYPITLPNPIIIEGDSDFDLMAGEMVEMGMKSSIPTMEY